MTLLELFPPSLAPVFRLTREEGWWWQRRKAVRSVSAEVSTKNKLIHAPCDARLEKRGAAAWVEDGGEGGREGGWRRRESREGRDRRRLKGPDYCVSSRIQLVPHKPPARFHPYCWRMIREMKGWLVLRPSGAGKWSSSVSPAPLRQRVSLFSPFCCCCCCCSSLTGVPGCRMSQKWLGPLLQREPVTLVWRNCYIRGSRSKSSDKRRPPLNVGASMQRFQFHLRSVPLQR